MWEMTCPRCGTWEEWRRHDVCPTCKAGTDVVLISEETQAYSEPPKARPIPQANRKIDMPDLSKSVAVGEPSSLTPQVAAAASDYHKRCESRLDDWIKFCAEQYGVDRLHA